MTPPFTLRDNEEIFGAIFISAIVLLIAGMILWTVIYELRVRDWLRNFEIRSAKAKGTLIEIQERVGEDHDTVLRYTFEDGFGKAHTGSMHFMPLWLHRMGLKFTIGQPLTILFNAQNPSLNFIEGYRDYYRKRETSYIASFVIIAAFGVTFWYTKSFLWPILVVVSLSIAKGILSWRWVKKRGAA